MDYGYYFLHHQMVYQAVLCILVMMVIVGLLLFYEIQPQLQTISMKHHK